MNTLLRSLLVPLLLACTGPTPHAMAAPSPLLLWPGAAPGDKNLSLGEEKDTSTASSGKVAGKSVIRLGNVTQPSLTLYRPSPDKDTGTAVVVCPGGGYSILAWDLEGTEVCEWLNSIGVTGVLLKYRVPKRPGQEKHAAALQDVQRALGIVRAHAAEWKLNPKRVGVLGFSAGGHLAALASTAFGQRAYDPVDADDQSSCRPDFAVLIYPAYLTVQQKGEKEGEKLAPELGVTSQTPPTFLAQSQDDGVRVESSVFYYLALKQARVPAEMHLYPTGGHGYGLRPSEHNVTTWPQRATEWLRAQGLLTSPVPRR